MLWSIEAAIAVTPERPGTGAGTSRSTVVPSPSSPRPLAPVASTRAVGEQQEQVARVRGDAAERDRAYVRQRRAPASARLSRPACRRRAGRRSFRPTRARSRSRAQPRRRRHPRRPTRRPGLPGRPARRSSWRTPACRARGVPIPSVPHSSAPHVATRPSERQGDRVGAAGRDLLHAGEAAAPHRCQLGLHAFAVAELAAHVVAPRPDGAVGHQRVAREVGGDDLRRACERGRPFDRAGGACLSKPAPSSPWWFRPQPDERSRWPAPPPRAPR